MNFLDNLFSIGKKFDHVKLESKLSEALRKGKHKKAAKLLDEWFDSNFEAHSGGNPFLTDQRIWLLTKGLELRGIEHEGDREMSLGAHMQLQEINREIAREEFEARQAKLINNSVSGVPRVQCLGIRTGYEQPIPREGGIDLSGLSFGRSKPTSIGSEESVAHRVAGSPLSLLALANLVGGQTRLTFGIGKDPRDPNAKRVMSEEEIDRMLGRDPQELPAGRVTESKPTHPRKARK